MSLLSRLAVQAARAYGILSAADKTKVVADYLVVAGGGGGAGTYTGGGGGAGGYQTSIATLSTLNTYSIAVGAGGSGTNTAGGTGTNGSNSVLSGTGLTTITSTGGGGGGGSNVSGSATNGAAGGSGGGGGSYGSVNGTGGTGTSGQGNNGGSGNGINGVRSVAGGGGGAGAVGGTSSSTAGGNGGAGSSSSISGSSVTYAGGGGGGSDAGAGGSGGSGGGGAGGGNAAGTAATVNTGGGGGGGGANNTGAAGGSGIVIISYTSATPKFVGGTITTSGGKQIHTFTSSGTLSPITPITASYLVVAGGGGGGQYFGGGGGAGGLLTSSTTLYSGATYIVTVGAGGTAATNSSTAPTSGSNSVLSGTGLTTITATGGGYGSQGGGGTSWNAASGGSGGGQGSTTGSVAGSGTSGQGFAGGTSVGAAQPYTSGGGGGAGAVGGNASGTGGGAGGIGVASSISGTSTYYAGGGGGSGGGTSAQYAGGAGGNGGGGAGGTANSSTGTSTVTPVSGTTNTGGGGGGGTLSGTNSGAGAAGGSGIVIISYAGSQQFNGGLVTTSGGNTIHTFTSTGALTPLTNNLNNSLRFRSSASAYLSRTLSSTSNRKTWTWSAWVKRGTLGSTRNLFCATDNTTASTFFGFGSYSTAPADTLYFYTDASAKLIYTTAVFRDPSAWYHITVTVDTTQATEANRVKLYVNGNQQTVTGTYPAQNADLQINSTSFTHTIGSYFTTANYLDGYLADVNFIDGQALEPYYFGNNDANGVWKPIQYKGTYGTNGFYLTFGNTTSTTTLGYDSSPNGNNWTCNNISLTAGTTYDAMTDVPTNTSATVANYCVLNATSPYGSSLTLSQGNLRTTCAGAYWASLPGTFLIPSTGKWYWEVTPVVATNMPYDSNIAIGITKNISTQYNTGQDQWPGYTTESYGVTNDVSSMYKWTNVTPVAYGSSYTISDVIGVGLDMDAGTLTYYKNGVSQGVAFSGLTGNFVPSLGVNNTGTSAAINFGQRPFSYTPPTGYVALNTYNLPTPTILQGNKYMDATLYTGNGSAGTDVQTVINAGQFKPDLVWTKSRSNAISHHIGDSVRGIDKTLFSNTTGAEATYTYDIHAFNSNGFTVGNDGSQNTSGYTYVGWQWQAGQGSTSSNTSGSITSTVSVNTTAGFSVVTYTSTTATSATIGHGLGIAPSMMIIKVRNGTTNNWAVYHKSLGNANWIFLNSTSASGTASGAWNTTDPTSSVFSVAVGGGTGNNWTNTAGYNYVAYCWAEIAGFSKFGSYTGNGSADGPFVYTGFRPKFILIKETTTGGASSYWFMWDSARNTYNLSINYLLSNVSDAEGSSSTYGIDIVSNGFKIRNTNGNQNTSGNNYIYAAFAENPFKNSNAR